MKPYWDWAGGVWGFRGMLNPPGHHSTGAIVAELSEKTWGYDATVQISDCDRKITLSFHGPNAEEQHDFDADLYKVDTLIHGLREFRKALLRERRKVERGR